MGGGGVSTKQQKKKAQYQYDLNKQAMADELQANRVNQSTPWGSINWSQDPSGQWSQTTTLNPAEQQRLDQQRGLLTGLGDVSQGLVGQIGGQIGQAMDWSKFAQGPTGAPTGPQFGQVGTGPNFNMDFGSIDPNELAKMGSAGDAAQAAAAQAREYELQKKLELEGLTDMPVADDATRQRVEDALYQRAQSRLDPMWQQRQQQDLDRLYAMGAREGDPLFEQMMANQARDRTDAYQTAMNEAIMGGGAEQSRLFNLGMASRQQGFNEALAGGQFTNQALMNQYQQGLGNAQMQQQANLANAAAQNQMAQFNAGQGLQGMLAGLNYNRGGVELGNAALQQGFQNQLAGTQFNNQTAQQGFQNAMAQNAEQSRIRNEQIQQALMERGLGMSELGAVLGMMGQVQNPQYNNNFAQGQVNPVDFYGGWLQNEQQKQANQAAGIGALAGIAGSALGGPMGGMLGSAIGKGIAGG